MTFINETAYVDKTAKLGKGTRVWHHCQVREGAIIGTNSTLSKNVYVDHNVTIGDNVKIQNNVSVYYKSTIGNGVFIGPHVCFTNDTNPRAINPNGTLKTGGSFATDWDVRETVVEDGASIGANCTILGGVRIGAWSLIGAGTVVTKDVEPYALVYGNPMQVRGKVCKCAKKLGSAACPVCGMKQ